MVVDSLRGTFTSDGDDVEKGSTGLFCFLSLRSVFTAVPKNKLCLTITSSEVLTFSHFQYLPFLAIFERSVFFRALRPSICFAFSVKLETRSSCSIESLTFEGLPLNSSLNLFRSVLSSRLSYSEPPP